jgi:hypothetical protein
MMTMVIDTPEGIAYAQFLSRKGAVGLEKLGLKRSGRSAYAISKEAYGLSGDRDSVLRQMAEMLETIRNSNYDPQVIRNVLKRPDPDLHYS